MVKIAKFQRVHQKKFSVQQDLNCRITSKYDIENATIKITLDTTNFDYDNATVIPAPINNESIIAGVPTTRYKSDIKIYEANETPPDPPPDWVECTVGPQDVSVSLSGSQWYEHWRFSINEDVYTRIYSDDDPEDNKKIHDRETIFF